MRKDEWIAEFVNQMVLYIRPHLSVKLARSIALHEWVRQRELAPEDAAKRWAENQDKRRSRSDQ